MNPAVLGTPCSTLPGRIRWSAPEILCGHPLIATGVEMALKQTPGIYSAKASDVSGRVLVKFHAGLPECEVMESIKNALISSPTEISKIENSDGQPPYRLTNNGKTASNWVFDFLSATLRSYLVVMLTRM